MAANLLNRDFVPRGKNRVRMTDITYIGTLQGWACLAVVIELYPRHRRADCAYGMNVFRAIFSAMRDLLGGRPKAVEKVIRDAKIAAQQEMSEQALAKGANAIVAVAFDFNELDGGGKHGMLFVGGTGTAVKLKAESNSD